MPLRRYSQSQRSICPSSARIGRVPKQLNAVRARINWMFTTEKARAKPAPASGRRRVQNLCVEVLGTLSAGR